MGILEGKTALVTGAGRGIGRAIALALAEEGAAVAVNYHRSPAGAEETTAEIVRMGGRAMTVGCDVSDYEKCGQMVEQVAAELGHIDIIVNNSGIVRDNLLVRMTKEEFDSVLDTNLKGAFYVLRHAARYLVKQRSGRIINISSVSGVIGNAGQANYASSKAGLIGLTKSAARELAGRGITVNAIAPGYIETDMTNALSDKMKDKVKEQIPMKRMGSAEEIAAAAVFLASDKASYITGQVLCVDGGMAM